MQMMGASQLNGMPFMFANSMNQGRRDGKSEQPGTLLQYLGMPKGMTPLAINMSGLQSGQMPQMQMPLQMQQMMMGGAGGSGNPTMGGMPIQLPNGVQAIMMPMNSQMGGEKGQGGNMPMGMPMIMGMPGQGLPQGFVMPNMLGQMGEKNEGEKKEKKEGESFPPPT